MTLPRSSVVVISRGRPAHLSLCLTALSYQDHPEFEIILVADAQALRQHPDLPIKRVRFDQANVSAARNRGISQAAGQVIAFIDDDAVAEPGWLSRLTEPFSNPQVIAATGWTRDRDGFSWQVRTHRIDRTGQPRKLDPDETATQLLSQQDGLPVSTLGTNCAFDASALRRIGGFDPAFAFHLDESDVNMRLTGAFPDGLTAVVPSAQVIHDRAGSDERCPDRTPRDLTAQGRSTAIFARRHAGRLPGPATIAAERRRLLRHMINGQLDPFGVPALLDTLRQGLSDGAGMALPQPPEIRHDTPPAFINAASALRDGHILAGWHWQAAELRRQAVRGVSAGKLVTLILLTPTFLPHKLQLVPGGWFEQRGGVWGRSYPGDRPLWPWRFDTRLRREEKMTRQRRNPSRSAGVRASCLSVHMTDKQKLLCNQ